MVQFSWHKHAPAQGQCLRASIRASRRALQVSTAAVRQEPGRLFSSGREQSQLDCNRCSAGQAARGMSRANRTIAAFAAVTRDEMSVILEKRANGVALVTIDRPDVLNALDVPAKERLAAIWREISADPAVRVAVLTGAGGKAFWAGSDIKEINRTGRMVTTETLLHALPGVGTPLLKPVLAALHGYCIGMGLTLALHCDLRLAARNTQLGYPEVRHGMISAVSAMRLPQVIPSARALELLLLARNISAEEALRIGLVNAVVDDVQAEALAWAATIAGYSPTAVQATKRLAMFSRRPSDAERAEIEAVRALVESR